jgi:ABC-2 type transport system ATP-binding protein
VESLKDIMETLLLENVGKSFRLENGRLAKALEAISFSVHPGGMTALVGPDGAGKSTLLRIIAGLLAPETGTLFFEGRPLSGQHNGIGYMPQRFGLYEDLSVQENLDLYADLYGLDLREREARYTELLSMSALEPFRKRLAGNLSGGMKQKLGLICTLLRPPKLLLLDEPTVGVDPLSRRELWRIIQNLSGSSGMSVIMSTSYLDEAVQCDDVILLFEGRSLASGPPETIMELARGLGYLAEPPPGDTPRSLGARLWSAPGLIDAVPQGGEVRFVHGNLSLDREDTLQTVLAGAAIRQVSPALEDSFMLLLRSRESAKKDAQHTALASQAIARDVSPKSDSADKKRPDSRQGDEPVIQARNVTRCFGDVIAVNNVSFSVRQGEVFGLLGPNGAGKTTTFRMLCGLLPPSGGSLFIAGVNVRDAREEARRHIGYVAQKFSLYGPLSVRENLDFFAGAYGLRGTHKKKRLEKVIADFSLEQHLNMPADDLPGGYKRRLAMAASMMHEPAILFLDEPTSGADPLARRDFWKRISALADQSVTVVITTHFMEEAEYCDRVLIQDNGMMLALDTPANIRARASGAGATMEDAFIGIVSKARAQKTEIAA